MMKTEDKKNLDTFGDTNSSNNIVKYPKIPAHLGHLLDDYGVCQNIIKHISEYLFAQYQDLNLDTFLGKKWIELTPEIIAEKAGLSVDYLLDRTINHPSRPYQCYQLESKGFTMDRSLWNKTKHNSYRIFTESGTYIYDRMFTDALYRMFNQTLVISETVIDRLVKGYWKKHYMQGFRMLDSIVIEEREGKLKAKVQLSQELISQIHLFFFTINKEKYAKLSISAKKHTDAPDLYKWLSSERNAHFYGKSHKNESAPYIIPFAVLCNRLKLKYKREHDDKDNWRYDNARKSIKEKLKKLVQADLLTSFVIERVTASNKTINVYMYFKKPDAEELEIISDSNGQRESICFQKWLSIVYREQLKPGSHPWDRNITDLNEILDRYCNQEYHSQWLANEKLHKEEKEKALNAAFAELYSSAEPQPTWTIDKKLKEISEAAKQRLESSNVKLIKNTSPVASENLNDFSSSFKTAYKVYFDYDYIEEELPDDIDIPKWDLKLLYTFFACDHFKKKTMTEFSKNAGYIRTKVKYFCKGEEYNTFLSRYYKEIVKSDSTFFIDMDADIKDIVLEAFQKGTVTSLQVEIGLQLSHIIEADAALNKANKVLQLIANTIDKEINVKAFLKPQKRYVLFPDEEYTIYPKRVN